MRLSLAAIAHPEEILCAAVADGQDVIRADENIDLADFQLISFHVHQMHDRKHGIAVFLDLGSLMAMARVLHREIVQAELVLHLLQLALGCVEQSHPDKAVRALDVIADLRGSYVAKFHSALVGNAVDEHGEKSAFGVRVEEKGVDAF
jgi:hypothetical protein